MLLRYEEVKQKPRQLLGLTGLKQAEFDQLLASFEAAWEQHRLEYYRPVTERQRAPGGGRRPQLQRVEDKLLFILVYFKAYPLQEVQAAMFGMSQGRANEWIHRLSAVLQTALGRQLHLPARDPATLEQVLADCESHSFLIDGTERPTQRSKDNELQRKHYSGKKNAHA